LSCLSARIVRLKDSQHALLLSDRSNQLIYCTGGIERNGRRI